MAPNQCDECYVGRHHQALLPYMRLFGTHMIILPNAPASRCDVCGEVAYEPRFLMTMQLMLEEIAKEQRSRGVAKQRVRERRPDWTPVRRGQ